MTSSPSLRVPIALLGPELESPNDSSVHGIVTLVWPYASSTQSLSLLLVEPDFRLRRLRGQVRVHFQGSSAKAVAGAHVGSGDELVLKLQGASWENDATVSTTPGRGIQWELRFGEFVVLEIQRPGQRPTSIEIDHPSLSPESPRQASPPLNFPLHNTQIPESIRKSHSSLQRDNGNIWSSPAFLKRGHFAATGFDPFAELEVEFPDSERKKRKKLGRRSGQWKFVEHTPSPEKEESEALVPYSSSSPIEAMQVDAGQAIEQRATLATPPLDISINILLGDSSPVVKEGSPVELNEDATIETANQINEGAGTVSKASISSFREDTIHEHEEEILFPEGSKEGKLLSEPALAETASNAVQALSRDSSPSIVSSRSQSSTPDSDNSEEEERLERDSASEAMWSGSASDFSLDGAFMSRLSQTEQVMPMASEISRRWVEMHKVAGNQHKEKITLQTRGVESSESSRKGVPSKNGLATQAAVDQPGNEAQDRIIPMVSASDQYHKSLEKPRTKAQDIEHDGEDVGVEDPRKDEMTTTDESWIGTSVLPEQVTNQKDVQVDSGTIVVEEIDTIKLEQVAREATPIDENPNDKISIVPTAIQDSVADMKTSMEPAPPQVEIIDLESSDDEDDQRYSLLYPDHAPASRVSANMKCKGAERLSHEDGSTKTEDSVLEEHESRIEISSSGFDAKELEAKNNEHDRAMVALGSMEQDTPSHQEEKTVVLQEEPSSDPFQIADDLLPQELSPEPIAPPKINEDNSYLRPPSDVNPQLLPVDVEISLPLQRLPSTAQDTFEGPFTSQIVTQNDSQKLVLEHETFTQSTLSAHADKTLPTPDSAQSTSTGIMAQDLENLERIDCQSSQVQVSKDSAMDTQIEACDIAAENKLAELNGARLQEPLAEADLHQRSTLQLKPDTLALSTTRQDNLATKGSSLIARVKEMRRLSSQTRGRHLRGSSASPWFSSRRSSEAIPKSEAESDAHASSPERAGENVIKTPKNSTPEKCEKRLSQSFIRSSPLQSPPSKYPTSSYQESQYLPFSQVATGFRTNLSYFVPLASLYTHYGTTVDVLAVAISSTSISRAKSGPKDYNQTLYLSDPSSIVGRAPTSLTRAQIFRPRKSCFPTVNTGDAVLLRNFKVHSFQKALSLISTNVSAWAIFPKDADVQIHGPPVEYGPEERAFARAHWNWWASLDAPMKNGLTAAVPKVKVDRTKKGLGFELPSSQSQQSAKSAKPIDDMLPNSLMEQSLGLGGSLESAEVKEEDNNVATQPRRVLRPRNARGQTSASPEKDAIPEVEEIHELRDGTRYVDRERVGVEEVERQRGVHELRDGTRYRDRVRE